MKENSKVLHLKSLLSSLDRENIKYCVLGDIIGFPDEIYSDIDMVVEPSQISLLNKFLFDFAKNRSLKIIQVLQHEQTAWCYVFFWFDDNLKPKFFNIDICSDYFWNGQYLISADEILKERIKNRSITGTDTAFYTPNPAKGFAYYLIKKTIKLNLNCKQARYLRIEWDRDSAGCKKEILRFWSGKDAARIAHALEVRDYNALNDMMPRLRKVLRWKLNFSIFNFYRELKRILQRILKPTGLLVAFIGPDGSGKSSTIDHIINDLMPAFRNTHVCHLRPRILLRNTKTAKPMKNPHGKAPRGQLSSVLKLFYYFFDFSIGYLLKIRPLITRSTLVLFDRYYHDILVDPKRFRYSASILLARVIGKAIPEPNIWILLDSPPHVIQLRKKETSYEETNRQRNAYLELSTRLNNCFVVDGSAPINLVVKEVKKAILTFLAGRTERRLGY